MKVGDLVRVVGREPPQDKELGIVISVHNSIIHVKWIYSHTGELLRLSDSGTWNWYESQLAVIS